MCVRDNKTRCERWHEHNDNYAINADACTFGIAIVTLRHWYRVSRWRHFVGSRTHISISWTFCPPNISCHVMSKHPFIHLDLVLFFFVFSPDSVRSSSYDAWTHIENCGPQALVWFIIHMPCNLSRSILCADVQKSTTPWCWRAVYDARTRYWYLFHPTPHTHPHTHTLTLI